MKIAVLSLAAALFACSDDGCGTGGGCCRMCTSGKACGDSCISASANCNAGPGCACNAPGALDATMPTAGWGGFE